MAVVTTVAGLQLKRPREVAALDAQTELLVDRIARIQKLDAARRKRKSSAFLSKLYHASRQDVCLKPAQLGLKEDEEERFPHRSQITEEPML